MGGQIGVDHLVIPDFWTSDHLAISPPFKEGSGKITIFFLFLKLFIWTALASVGDLRLLP